jgi:hypothetical protein
MKVSIAAVITAAAVIVATIATIKANSTADPPGIYNKNYFSITQELKYHP